MPSQSGEISAECALQQRPRAVHTAPRDGEEVALTVKGAVPVLISVKAIALAQDYVKDEGIELRFAVQFRNLEDPELNNTPSTYLHMAIISRHTL